MFQSAEKTDEDFQVDDVFVSKAAQQQSGARNEEKERGKAIFGELRGNAVNFLFFSIILKFHKNCNKCLTIQKQRKYNGG